MSRTSLPWYRAYWTLVMDEDYSQLSIAQQGVYHNLRDWAAGQTPRGTFQVRNLESLARAVACGDVELLQSVIEILTTTWRNADGTPHVVITEERGAFTTWEKWQRPPSQEPEAVAERAARSKEANNGNKTVIKRPINDAVEREVEGEDRSKEIGGGGSTKRAHGSTAAASNGTTGDESIGGICASLGVQNEPRRTRVIRAAIDASPHVPPVAEADKCVLRKERDRPGEWERMSESARVLAFANSMKNAEQFYLEDQAKHAPARASPNGPAAAPEFEPSPEERERHQRMVALWQERGHPS